jgi:threonyl-tRNA synthetase
VLRLVERVYGAFGLGFHLELSTRPEKSIGTDEQWALATDGLRAALEAYGSEYQLNEGDGAFYGPKIDIHIKDALGAPGSAAPSSSTCRCPNVSTSLYVDRDNQRRRPIMIHRTILGSIERFFGILIEHFAGKYPLWLAPVQAVVLPINDDLAPYAGRVRDDLQRTGLRAELDDRAESLNKKIREAQLKQIPLILTIGAKEQASGALSIRTLDGNVRYGLGREVFLDTVAEHISARRLNLNLFAE